MDAFTLTELPSLTRYTINHPMADEVSVLKERADNTCFELAFFSNDEWVTEVLPEFAGYADTFPGFPPTDTLVYRYVPGYMASAFIDQWL